MSPVAFNELRKNPKYYNYLILNSNFITIINRYGFKPFKKIIDEKYHLTGFDRVNKFVEKVSFINEIIDSVK